MRSLRGPRLTLLAARCALPPPPSGNTIRRNLVMGTVKDMEGKSGFDLMMPASFQINDARNYVDDNIAAGSERLGFMYFGLPCNPPPGFRGSFSNNVAHSNLAGMWLRASDQSAVDGCTLLANFTTYMNWDFGIIRCARGRTPARGVCATARGQGCGRCIMLTHRSVRQRPTTAGAAPCLPQSSFDQA